MALSQQNHISPKKFLLIASLGIIFCIGAFVAIKGTNKPTNNKDGGYAGWKEFTFGDGKFVVKYPANKADPSKSAEPTCKPLDGGITMCSFASDITGFTVYESDAGNRTLPQEADERLLENGYHLVSRSNVHVNGLDLIEIVQSNSDFRPHSRLFIGYGKFISLMASNRVYGDFFSSNEDIDKFLNSFALVNNSVATSVNGTQNQNQSNNDIHTMSDQELERDLSLAWEKYNSAVQLNCTGSTCDDANINMKNAENRAIEIGKEIRQRRISKMSDHDKNLMAKEEIDDTNASTWKVIDDNETSIIYADTSSISFLDNSIRRIHLVQNFKNSSWPAKSGVLVYEFNCTNKSVWVDNSPSYSEPFGKGKQVGILRTESIGKIPGKYEPLDSEIISFSKAFVLACANVAVPAPEAAKPVNDNKLVQDLNPLIVSSPPPVNPVQQTPSISKVIESMLSAAIANDMNTVKSLQESLGTQAKSARGDKKIARDKNKAGITALNLSGYTTAVALFKEGLSADQGDIELLNNLGYALMMDGQLDSAKAKLVEVLNLDITRSAAWANLGEVSAKSGDQDNAVAAFKLAYYFSHAPDKSIEFFKKLSETDPDERIRNASVKASASFPNIQPLKLSK